MIFKENNINLNLDDLKKLLKPADILMIVPPFFLENFQSMGVHSLQARCREAGFTMQIFYANIHFASYIKDGNEVLCNINNAFIGERLFAKAAFGNDIGNPIHENIYDNGHIFGKERAQQIGEPFYLFPALKKLDISQLIIFEEMTINWVEEITRTITEISYKIIGCTSSYEQINSSIAILKRVKNISPETITLIGGFNCEGEAGKGIASLDPEHKIIDYIFSGEAENSLINFLVNGKNNTIEEKRIIHSNPVKDLDSLPKLDYTDYFEQLYSFQPSYLTRRENINLCYETSRGCWWGEKNQCIFCGCNGERISFRQKSKSKVMEELQELKKYRINYLQMTDLIMPDNYFKTLLPELKTTAGDFKLYYEQKADLSYEKLKQLKNANITEIQPGMESLSNSLLKKMRKGISTYKNIQLLRDALTLQIKVYWNMIWGFPDEQIVEYENMLSFMPLLFHLQPPVGLFHLGITRFSPYFADYKKYGINNIKPVNSYFEIFPEYAEIEKIAGFFIGEYYAETYENNYIIKKLASCIQLWNDRWHSLIYRPLLHLTKESSNKYILTDTREIDNNKSTHIINRDKVLTILSDGKYIASKDQEWAIENSLALLIEDRYISLITLNHELKDELASEQAYSKKLVNYE